MSYGVHVYHNTCPHVCPRRRPHAGAHGGPRSTPSLPGSRGDRLPGYPANSVLDLEVAGARMRRQQAGLGAQVPWWLSLVGPLGMGPCMSGQRTGVPMAEYAGGQCLPRLRHGIAAPTNGLPGTGTRMIRSRSSASHMEGVRLSWSDLFGQSSGAAAEGKTSNRLGLATCRSSRSPYTERPNVYWGPAAALHGASAAVRAASGTRLRRRPVPPIGWRGGTSPPRSRQTGREPLDSSGFLLRLARIRLLSVARLAKRPQHEGRGLRSSLITRPSSLLRPRLPQCAASGTLAFGFLASAYSRSRSISGATARLVPEFRTRARTTLMPPLRRTPPGQEREPPARLVPGHSSNPGFDVV